MEAGTPEQAQRLGHGLEYRGNIFRFPKDPKHIFLPPSEHTDPEVQLSSYLIFSASSVTGHKRRGFDADRSAVYRLYIRMTVHL